MDFDVPKRENGENTFFQRVSIGGFCVKSQIILENDFLTFPAKNSKTCRKEFLDGNKAF